MQSNNCQPGRAMEIVVISFLAAATSGAGVALIVEGSKPGVRNQAAVYAESLPTATFPLPVSRPATAVKDRPRTAKPTPERTSAPRRMVKPKPARATVKPAPATEFKNCEQLRRVHPGGVEAGHPAYRPRMDRDKDGWACEK